MTGSPTNWDELVTTGLLGTDRRPPPATGVALVDDLVDDSLPPTDARRLLTAVSAAVVAARCGVQPAAPLAPTPAPSGDRRPLLRADAARRWREIARSFPLLEDEWLELAVGNRWRPPADVLVALLGRCRTMPRRHAVVMALGGELAEWLVAAIPELGCVGRPAPVSGDVPSAVPSELADCLQRSAGEFAARLVAGVDDGTYAWAHRTTLHHALVALPAEWLPIVLAALRAGRDAALAGDAAGAPVALWESLLEFAAVRRALHTDLEVPR